MKSLIDKLILALLIIMGCKTSEPDITYSNLIIEGKNYNKLIKDRIPDYGNGHKDGCIIERQISLTFPIMKRDSITGLVTDSKSHAILPFANIEMTYTDYTIKLHTDSLGQFHSSTGIPFMIQVNSIGYRSLNINILPGYSER